MLVKVTRAFYSGTTLHTVGRVLSVNDDIAATWLTQGVCEHVTRARKVETAIKPPAEKAVTRSRRKRA
jgi:hypothetical protein